MKIDTNTLIVAVTTIIFISCLGSIVYIEHNKKEPLKSHTHCAGYTVLDQKRIVLCNGDTLNYQWQHKIK